MDAFLISFGVIFVAELGERVPEVLALANKAIEANTGQFRKALQPAREGKDLLPALVIAPALTLAVTAWR